MFNLLTRLQKAAIMAASLAQVFEHNWGIRCRSERRSGNSE
jgi:hypothetical protein